MGGQGGGEGVCKPYLAKLPALGIPLFFADLGTLSGSQVQKGKVMVFRSTLETVEISQTAHL